jgi:Family of unknown function (DUF5722)
MRDMILDRAGTKRSSSWARPFSRIPWGHLIFALGLVFGPAAWAEAARPPRSHPNSEHQTDDAAERKQKDTDATIVSRKTKEAAARTVLDYLSASFPGRIESVRVKRDEILLDGTLVRPVSGPVYLAEAGPEMELWRNPVFHPLQLVSQTGEAGPFHLSLPRREGDHDRITFRWCLLRSSGPDRYAPCSHFVYATDLSEAAVHALQPKTSPSKKGLAGISNRSILPELVDLGIHQTTVNVFLSGLFATQVRPGWQPFQHEVRTYWVDSRQVERFDQTIGFCTRHDMVVAAIILVGFGGETGFARAVVHPEADRAGHYAMPNLTSAEGVAAYGAALAFLAERYAQPGDPHGRISHWILHNEIDYGWVWTNMGKQPLALYLDTYVRSMRLAYYTARRFNPNAKVFISLTHDWNVAEDPSGKTYAPKRMLEGLAQYSRVEGDFEWGVAYHPYPQSLFKPDTWNDTKVRFDFDTEMITMKNIEVLDAWMRRPDMLYHGSKLRTVLLSEQGFHTPDYSDRSERLQAAALVYTWHKIRALSTIEAFDNHRWVDHPAEAGLKLGLRTFPTGSHPDGVKKFAWKIYQALDTPEEAAATAFAKEIIGVRDFSDIPYRGVIGESKR